MHQAASSFLSFVLSPLNWIILLLGYGYFSGSLVIKKTCRILALCIFLLFSNEWILDKYANQWQPQPVTIAPGNVYSCGIIPGGFASPDQNSNGYFNASADRFIQAVKLYKLGTIRHILVSGGNGKIDKKNFHEAGWVKGELITMGVPDSVIFIEDRSANTADNAMISKQILDSLSLAPPYVLITSAMHMPRASVIFKNAGVEVIPFPCNYVAGRGSFGISSLVPQIPVLAGWNVWLKEAVGYFWYSHIQRRGATNEKN
ncbi:MAG: YdcF family protein [Ginsengibacter sp.]